MAFSDSFGLGNSTLLNLESEENKAFQVKTNNSRKTAEAPRLNANGLDMIDESPTNSKAKSNKSHSRHHHRQNGAERKRKFQKSKSDTTLEEKASFNIRPGGSKSISKDDNYSEFFKSEFSLGDGQKSKPVLFFSTSQLETAVQGITNSAQLNKMDSINLEFGIGIGKTFKEMVDDQLQLENGAGIEGNISEDLKAPVFSEDLQNLLNDSTMNNEKSLKVLQLSDDDWKQSLMLSEFQDPVLMVKNMEGNVPVEEKCENVLNIDDATFICPDEDGKEFAEKTIYCIKNEIQNTLEDEQIEKFNPLGDFCKTPKTNSSNALRNFDSIYNKSKPKLKVEENFLSPKPLLRTQEPYEMKQDLEELKQISAWNLPLSILKEYEKKGINKMFDWQIECLRNPKVLFDHCNLVYSAPTSAGKTLVSEILLIKTILERGKKVIMILPFISVVREKMFYLQDLLTPSGYRVEGFFGGYTPPGGFDSINVAICTIEKANSIVNKLLEAGKLDVIGTVVVDEIHLISDPGRGYILELLLSKVLYMSKKYGIQIQIIAMSATLANVELLKKWLDAELYITNYRPVALKEMIKIGTKIYDNNLEFQREISTFDFSAIQDPDNVAQLCIETIAEGCSVIVFCPSKDWCENLSIQLAGSIYAIGRSGSEIGSRIKEYIKRDAIEGVKKQLKEIPSGLDSVLEKTINFACAFHHAGLTSEERDVIETCFKSGALKIIVATSTLSSGVNLPARRVIIRSPLFGGKQMSSLTYKQMIGRAGRTGKDTLGESILICSESNKRIGKELVSAPLNPIRSCLEMESSTHLKRALLEVISSGVATTKYDIKNFVKCTLLHAQKEITEVEKNNGAEENANSGFIFDSIDFLIEYEFIRLQHDEENNEDNYVATRLGIACLASSMPPTDALILFSELQKSRRCFVLESELHAVYLVTPYSVCYQLQELDWLMYLDLWEKLSPAMKKVGELVGVRESFLVRAMRGQMKLDYKLMQIHKRFYTALALQELVNETPINVVAVKYKCTRGMLQSLQQMASTFAGIVNAFCNSLNWSMLSLIVSQFKERLFFGVHRDLIDLMKLPNLNYKRARALFDFGIKSLIDLANADIFTVEKILHNSMCFDTAKKLENEDEYEKNLRNNMRNLYITGKAGLTVKEAAKMLLDDARQFVQHEIGAGNINWCPQSSENHKIGVNDSLYVSSESSTSKRKSMSGCNDVSPPKLKKDVTPNEDKQKENSIGISTNNIQIRSAIGGNSNENDSGDVMICKKNENSSLKAQQDMEEKIVGITSHQTQSDMKTLNNTIIQGHTCYENNVPISNAYKNSNEGLKVLGVLEDQRSQEESHRLKSTSEIFKCSVHSTFKVQKEVPHSVDIQLIKIKTKQDGIIERNPPLRYNNENDPEIIKNDHDPQRSGKLSPPNSTTYAENIKQNKFTQYPQNMEQVNKLITKKELKAKQQLISKQTTTTASPLPRRSPRNHLSSSTRIENPLNVTKLSSLPFDNDLFMDDSSFEMNSVIVNAVDKIQRAEVKPPCNSLNKSSEEIAGSQEMTFQPKTQSTRFLRSYKDQTDNKTPIKNTSVRRKSEKDQSSSPNFSLKTNKSPSIEISDITLGNSLMQNPIQLNSSHILSISKTEPDALSLNCIQILDVCGSHMLLKNAMKELREAKVLGFSIGIEKKPNKRKPLIGANLLINQVNTKENTIETDLDFPVDDCSYVSGISVVRTSNVSLFFNLQTENTGKGITREMKIEAVRTLVENTELTLQIFDSKEQLKILRTAIPQIEKVCCKIEDPKVANWLLQPDKPMTLANMAHQFAPECKALINLAGKSRGYNSIGLDSNCAIYGKIRSSIEACVTMHILRGQVDNLERIGTGQLHKFFIDLEMPLQLSLCEMEIYGFPTNESALRNLFQQMVDIMKKLETKIYEAHGSKFNLGSSSAVARVVGLHRKSNGRISTSKQILEKIDSPIAVMIMVYRKLNVTLAKTVQPLLRSVFDNRIRGQSITFTSTGRISMQEPNLQNVAKDFEVTISTSEKINVSCRSSFFSPKGRCLISADFCQLEMRILAHLSQDPQLLQVMKSEKDVFTAIAAKWNKVAEDNVSERLRNGTKQICYGIVYGMGMRSLAESLKCNEHEAQSVAEQFHTAYTGIRLYTEKVIKFAKQHGYVETITGRRRYLDNINSIEPQLKSQAERQAVNSTIQGSAADITKSAILRMEKNINKYQEKMGISRNCVHLVLHLHDELIFEVPEDKAKKVAKVLSVTMENCVRLSVPLKVKLKIGKSWGSLREVKL